jgi:hypothetical protein
MAALSKVGKNEISIVQSAYGIRIFFFIFPQITKENNENIKNLQFLLPFQHFFPEF